MSKPNIFKYATKELSQDAFLCWLIAWSDLKNEHVDPLLYGAGNDLVRKMVSLAGLEYDKPRSINVRKQFMHIDILAELGEDIILLIEDKINSGIHSNQLDRYKISVSEKYPDRKLVCIYFKISDQSNYRDVLAAGFHQFGRRDMLLLIKKWRQAGSHPILDDFGEVVEIMDIAINSFTNDKPSDWSGNLPWIGLYKFLQNEFPEMEWQYTPNKSGGFMAAWWHSSPWVDPKSKIPYNVYLQIEQGGLCFKIEVEGSEKREARDRWRTHLAAVAERIDYPLERPARVGVGTWMTVAKISQLNWMATTPSGLIDTSKTFANLRSAMATLDEAIRN